MAAIFPALLLGAQCDSRSAGRSSDSALAQKSTVAKGQQLSWRKRQAMDAGLPACIKAQPRRPEPHFQELHFNAALPSELFLVKTSAPVLEQHSHK